MSLVMMDKTRNQRNQVSVEHALHYLVEQSRAKSQTAVDIYQDKDGMRTDDVNALAGQRGDKKQGDVWTSFYDKVKEVKDYHRRFSMNQTNPELQNAEWFYQRAFEADRSETLFSGEEELGKRVDMNEHFVKYLNIKKIANHRRTRFREETYARMKRKTPDLEPDDPIVEQTVSKEFNELDYIEWLKTFDQFHDVPRYCKYKDNSYTEYVNGIITYLHDFLLRTQPMVGIEKLEQQ